MFIICPQTFLPSPKVSEKQKSKSNHVFTNRRKLVEEHVRGLEDPGTNEDVSRVLKPGKTARPY